MYYKHTLHYLIVINEVYFMTTSKVIFSSRNTHLGPR